MSARLEPRAEALACDAALFGLDEPERHELDAFGSLADEQLALELAAAEVAVYEHEVRAGRAEPLPADLADRVFAAASDVVAAPSPRAPRLAAPTPRPSVVDRPRSERDAVFVAGWLLAAAAIVLAIVGWNRRPPPPPVTPVAQLETPAQQREKLLGLPGTARTPWQATTDEAARGASGDVVWHAGVQKGVMRIAGLAPNERIRFQYQLWIFDESRDEAQPVDGGVFDVGSNGEVLVPIEAKLKVGKAKLFAITVERPGGVVVSKRERIVLTATPPSG